MSSLWIDPPKWKKPCTGAVFECNNYETAKLGCNGCSYFGWNCKGVFMVEKAVDHRPLKIRDRDEKLRMSKKKVTQSADAAKSKNFVSEESEKKVLRSAYFGSSGKKGEEVAVKAEAAETTTVVKSQTEKVTNADLIRKELRDLVHTRRSGKSLRMLYFALFDDFFEDIDYVLTQGFGWGRICQVLKSRGHLVSESTARRYWTDFLKERKKS